MVYLALNNIYLALDRVLVIALFNDNCLEMIQITVFALWFHSLCSVIEPDHSFFLLQVPSRQNSFQSSPFPLPLDTLATTLVCIFSFDLNRSYANQKNSTRDVITYRSRERLKAFLFSHQKNNKNHAASAWNILQTQYKCAEVAQYLI